MEGHSGQQNVSPRSKANAEDGLAALQLPFLQDQSNRFLSQGKDWIQPGDQPDTSIFDDVEASPIDFFGHYSAHAHTPLLFQGGQVPQDIPSFHATPQGSGIVTPGMSTPYFNNGEINPTSGDRLNTDQNFNMFLQSIQKSLDTGRAHSGSPGMWDTPGQYSHQGLPHQDHDAPMTQMDLHQQVQQPQQEQDQQLHQQPQHDANGTRPTTTNGNERSKSDSSDAKNETKKRGFTEEELQEFLNTKQFLNFLPAKAETLIFDHRGNKCEMDLQVSLSGNFFLSQPTGPAGTISSDNPTLEDLEKYELTFYRRNLFQVLATISNTHNAVYAANNNNPALRSRILSLSMAVTVDGNDDKKPKILLYCPPKSVVAERKVEQEPAIKPVHPRSNMYSEVIDWKRLQFRTATAHNGRKKLQNYFTINVSVYAELENAQRVRVLTANSWPIVVRGRNPQFYSKRDNIMLSDGNPTARMPQAASSGATKMMLDSPSFTTGSSSSPPALPTNGNRTFSAPSVTTAGKGDAMMAPFNVTDLSVPDRQNQHDISAWDQPSTSLDYGYGDSPFSQTTGGPSSHENPREHHMMVSHSQHDQLINRHRGQESKSPPETGQRPAKVKKESDDTNQPDEPRSLRQMIHDKEDHEDSSMFNVKTNEMDYEYFPMPLNYWLPPVEVVYRPHAIHHPLKFPQGKTKKLADSSKRYFTSIE
ncbi:hypothetical protein TRVA0_029S01486 [Trichomonascus vanleenenianus]|uniref:uncharacterized protein n=1 Tax=Trichomonascus vanleenenianus TaxID=2268995 RepID=UPI003EC9F74B